MKGVIKGREQLISELEALRRRVAELERLEAQNEKLCVTSEELRTAEEELRASNDELQAANDELQTTEAELRASNEELQATNVELQREIIERKRVGEQLRRSEEKYSTLVEQGNDGIIIIQGGVLRFASSKMVKVTGFSVENALGRSFVNFVSPEYKQLVVDWYKKRMSGEKVPSKYEIEILSKEGKKIPVEISASSIEYEGIPADMAIVRDISERKRMEQELQEKRKQLEAQNEELRKANEELQATEAELRASNEELQAANDELQQEIIERRRAEESLRESEEKYRSLFEDTRDAIMIRDQGGKITHINQAALDLFGYEKGEMVGMDNIQMYVDPADREELQQEVKEKEAIKGYEVRLRKKDGSEMDCLLSASFHRDADNKTVSYRSIIHDITERKQMEQHLVITDRLASIGELASGIAHELNNPLTSVIGFSQLLLDKNIPDDIKEDVRIIFSEAQRAAGVVKNLLTFARRHAQVKELVNINSIVEKVLELRAYEHRVNNIRVKTQFAADLPEIMADYFQLQQVFLNIVINAEYFMIEAHKKGTLTITTERVDNVVRASFIDDGPGIPEENLGHLFDPFFTTKEVGRGTGLGLSICHGIIIEHGGQLYAASELGKGTTFTVELPISDH